MADVLKLVCLLVNWCVRITTLVAVLEVARKTNQPLVSWFPEESDTLLCLIHLVYLLIKESIVERTIIMVIECAEGESELVRHLSIV